MRPCLSHEIDERRNQAEIAEKETHAITVLLGGSTRVLTVRGRTRASRVTLASLLRASRA